MAFNKLFVMAPLMFAVRKIDGEDPDIVFMLRCSYAIIQCLLVLAVLYVNMAAAKINKSKLKDKEIFVPPPPQPFADPNAKIRYTRTTLGEHAVASAKKLGFSSVSGLFMTVGLHWYKGMIIGLAMQTVMGPLNLMENSFAKTILLRGTKNLESNDDEKEGEKKPRFFDEKYRNELSDKDEIVDKDGNLVTLKKEKALAKKSKPKSFADILLDTWDDGEQADIESLMKALKKDNVNFKTKKGWSPIMIMSAIKAKGSVVAMKKMKSMGASVSMTDVDGWNALHWACFHGSLDGAKTIIEEFDGMNLGLHLVKDAEGLTPLDNAIQEQNKEVISYVQGKVENNIASSGIAEEEGIRKRK